MKIIGLTGGSGTGKSEVARLLCLRGAGWVDADVVYRRLCAENSDMLTALQQAFGDILDKNGGLDRKKLAEIVFGDAALLQKLNEITTPYIRRASLAAIAAQVGKPFVLYDAPTLFETGADALCERVIGVLADRETRIRRIMARDGLTEAAARARVHAQPDDAFYRARCAELIENNGDFAALAAQANALYARLAT